MKTPILVTGMPRSGTSWIGRTLDATGETVFFNEPLNPKHPPGRSPGLFPVEVRHYYQYFEGRRLQAYDQVAQLRFDPIRELAANHAPRDLVRTASRLSSCWRGRLRDRHALIVDPYAIFNALQVARRGYRVVVVVRHPAAVVSSHTRLGWSVPSRNFLEQPALVHAWLGQSRRWLSVLDSRPAWEQAAIVWKMIYDVVAVMREQEPSILLVRHEDMSRSPMSAFAALCEALGLSFNAGIRRAVDRTTRGPDELSLTDPYAIALNSQANLYNWHHRLREREVEKIRRLTEPTASLFYEPSEWLATKSA